MPATDFTKMVPGFDFLQGLMNNAGAGMPSMSQWIAPTLDPDEVDKRIQELRTVQYWLDQNSRLLDATIKALEVQRMTLATLRTMNMPMSDLRESMKLRPEPEAAPTAEPEPEPETAPPARKRAATKKAEAPAATGPAGPVDPVQWWGALTRQFAELAANALKEAPADATPAPAAAPAPKAAARTGKRR